MNIGATIKQLRKDAGLTQEELATNLSISRSTLACYETNVCQVPNIVLIALAKFFEVPTDYILGLID